MLAKRGAKYSFAPFAHSIWRIDDELVYLLPEEPARRAKIISRYRTIDDLLAEGYSYAEIKRLHVNQRDFINSLIKN